MRIIPTDRKLHAAGFTLVELLIVAVVIGILVGLVTVCVRTVRESGKRTVCANNLRQIGVGALAFRRDHGVYPAGDPNSGVWPACVAAGTVFDLQESYDADLRTWACPDGRGPVAYTDEGNVVVGEAAARGSPSTYRAVTSYQYLANLAVPQPWMIRRGREEAGLALAGDFLGTVGGEATGNHIATAAWAWDTGALKGRWGLNEVFLDGHVRWFPGNAATGYFTNWATFLMVLSD